MDSLPHQDWSQVILRSKSSIEKEINSSKVTIKRGSAPNTKINKLENDIKSSSQDEAPPLASLPILNGENRKILVNARVAKSLTQVQLAQRINVLPKIINDLESGKPITDRSILQRINKELGIKPTLKFMS